jgi:hypothetical protein
MYAHHVDTAGDEAALPSTTLIAGDVWVKASRWLWVLQWVCACNEFHLGLPEIATRMYVVLSGSKTVKPLNHSKVRTIHNNSALEYQRSLYLH